MSRPARALALRSSRSNGERIAISNAVDGGRWRRGSTKTCSMIELRGGASPRPGAARQSDCVAGKAEQIECRKDRGNRTTRIAAAVAGGTAAAVASSVQGPRVRRYMMTVRRSVD